MTDAGVYTSPTLDLDFTSGVLDSRITFTRAAGAATYFDSAGVLQNAGTNVARFDYDPVTLAPGGLLIEEARTNTYLQSGNLAVGAPWTVTGATATTGTAAPDGTTNAAFIKEDGGNSTHQIIQANTFSSGVTYAWSIFAKAGTRHIISANGMGLAGASLTPQWDVGAGTDITTGSNANFTHGIQAMGNGWYRCWFTWLTANTTAATIFMCAAANGTSYQGDNASGLYLWGAVMEAGAFATSYIPTTGATATRAADVAQIASIASAAWFNAAQGTIAADFDFLKTVSSVVGFSDGSTVNMFFCRDEGSVQVTVASSGLSVAMAGILTSPLLNRIAGSYQSGTFSGCLNGGAVAINNALSAGPFLWTTRLALGASPWALDGQICGHLRRVRYWNSALPGTQMQQITT